MHLDAKETADIWGVNGTGLNDQDSGELDMAEVKRALMALDVDEEELLGWGEEGSCSTAIMQAIDTNHDGKVSLEELTAAVRLQRFLGVQDGRYYVLLSLREAETLRAAIHARNDCNHQQSPHALFATASFALRVLPSGLIADSTANYREGRPYQTAMAVQSARFFDCQSHFTTRSVSLLQRCLASNTSKERMAFFHEIKCCRRRAQKIAIADTALARVLLKEEELEVMYQRAVASRIKATLAGLNMGVADAFVSFDVRRRGKLSPEELYHGLEQLGLHIPPAELRDLIIIFDADRNGSVSLPEFKAALSMPGLDDIHLSSEEQSQNEREKESESLSGQKIGGGRGGHSRASISTLDVSHISLDPDM